MEILVSILKEFIQSDHDYVFLLKGDWGIGKTYFWNNHEKDIRNANEEYNYYSKVSLYGKSKPLDIYREILFNTEEINEGKKTKTIYEKTLNILSKSPYIQGFIGNILIEHSISKINHSIIVLDDFERISTDNYDEIFGVVNDLKEKKNKVIIISNIQKEYDELLNHIEKNIDIEFLYDPNIDEIIDNIFDSDIFNEFTDKVKSIAHELELKNMRAIKKLHRNIEFLLDRTSKVTVKELIQDLTFYTLCRFSQTPKIPSYDYLTSANRYAIFSREDATDQEKEATRLANKYLRIHKERIKDGILKLIEYGYLEKSETDYIKDQIENNVENRERYKPYDEAWDYYHNNFENNTERFIEKMYNGCQQNLDQIDPRNFESSMNILIELDEEERAEELIDQYFEVNKDRFREVLASHPHSLPMSFEVKGEEMNRRLNLIRDENQEIRSIEEIAKKVTYANGWGHNDVTELASHSVDDYEEFIRETKSDDLNSYIKRLIEFGNYQSSSNEQIEIKEKTIEALTRICQDGGLNKLRIENKFDIEC